MGVRFIERAVCLHSDLCVCFFPPVLVTLDRIHEIVAVYDHLAMTISLLRALPGMLFCAEIPSHHTTVP